MNITHNETEPLTSEITLQLAPEDYKEPVMKTLKEHAKKANLPGFRPGKVPMGMIKKMVGKSVLIEELNQIIQKELFDYIEKENLDILGNPIPIDTKNEDYFDLSLNKELEFTYEVGLAPEIVLQWDQLEAVEDYEIEIDEAYLEKELENQRERHAEVSNPEEVQEGDILYGQLQEVDEQGKLVEEGYERMIVLNPTRVENPKVFEPFVGQSLTYSMPWDPSVLADDPEKIKELLFLEAEEWEQIKDKKFHFTLKRINRLEKAALNEDFFKKVIPHLTSSPEETEEDSEEPIETEVTLEVFKEELAKLLKEEWDKELKTSLNYRIRDQLLKVHDIPLPDEFLKKLYEAEQKENKPQTAEEQEKAYEQYARGMRWTLIVDRIRKDNSEIDVTEEELKESILNMYRMYNPNMSKEEELNVLNSLLQNPELINNQSSRLIEEKVFNFLRDQVEVIQTPISVTDFMKKQEEEAAAENIEGQK